jgi:hypothetical protein
MSAWCSRSNCSIRPGRHPANARCKAASGLVLLRVVVDFSEQDPCVATQPIVPAAEVRSRARAEQRGEDGRPHLHRQDSEGRYRIGRTR